MATSDFERARKQQEREAEKRRRADVARAKEQERQRRQQYVEGRKAEAERIDTDLVARVSQLQSFLVDGLKATANLTLSQLRRVATVPALRLGNLDSPLPAPEWGNFAPPAPGFWRRSLAQSAVAEELSRAREAFSAASAAHAAAEVERIRMIKSKRAEHLARVERENAEVNQYNAKLDALARQVADRNKDAVETYLLTMIGQAPLPSDFPREWKVAFDPKSEHAVLEIELPGPDCVPSIKGVRYIPARDEISEIARPPREKDNLYRGVIAQLSLLVLRTLLNSDANLRQISLNGRVRHVNPATGHEERPHIISVVVGREQFESLVLDRVKPEDCLRHLRALVSPHPSELEGVAPLVEFDKSRLAFIKGLEVISGLDARPDLMAMSPTEFEHLIRELLEADPSIESVESLTTRQSNDGGVDGVVYIKQPFGRSMTVVQVKQYARNRNLGPAHIRELIGAMHEVKSGNGLLVTTSDFTVIARANAAEFGRISLIDGNNLVYMIKNLLGTDVLISDRRK
jgi:restriction system protein